MEETSDKEVEVSRFEIKDKEDLNTRISRSSFCKVELHPLEIEIEPAKTTRPFVSNIEGLLNRVEKTLSSLESDEKIEELLDYIDRVKSGEANLTVVFKDPTKNSYIGEENE